MWQAYRCGVCNVVSKNLIEHDKHLLMGVTKWGLQLNKISQDTNLPFHAIRVPNSAVQQPTGKDGKGIIASRTGDGQHSVTVCLLSPADLNWEKHGGQRFKHTAGITNWGQAWQQSHRDNVEAVLVLGVPTQDVPRDGSVLMAIGHAIDAINT